MNNIPTRALWNFYKDTLFYSIAFTLLSKIAFGNLSALLIFISIGVFIGFWMFYILKKQELYFYYNLGYTKSKLLKVIFLINLLIGMPIVIVILFFMTMLFGDFKLIAL